MSFRGLQREEKREETAHTMSFGQREALWEDTLQTEWTLDSDTQHLVVSIEKEMLRWRPRRRGVVPPVLNTVALLRVEIWHNYCDPTGIPLAWAGRLAGHLHPFLETDW